MGQGVFAPVIAVDVGQNGGVDIVPGGPNLRESPGQRARSQTWIDQDPDLDFLRGDEKFKTLVKTHRARLMGK